MASLDYTSEADKFEACGLVVPLASVPLVVSVPEPMYKALEKLVATGRYGLSAGDALLRLAERQLETYAAARGQK